MAGEKDLAILLRTLRPALNAGEYVFCVVDGLTADLAGKVVMHFKEGEGTTVILKREVADQLKLRYSFVASWITLTVHSSLEAVGMTAAFSAALTKAGISCNVVAAYHHDHIFVDKKDAEKAVRVLTDLSREG